jgi:hypothetical protein
MSDFPKRLTVRINVDKVLKNHLYKGVKGTYLNLILHNTPGNPYGQDFLVKQEISKELRDTVEMEIIGEAKAWALGEGTPTPKEDQKSKEVAPTIVEALKTLTPPAVNITDDLPF